MEKGLAIIEVNDTETKGVHIDQETIECARINSLTKRHAAKVAKEAERNRMKAEKARKEAEHNRIKEEKAYLKKKAYALDSTAYILLRMATLGGSVWACAAEMLDPIIGIPVAMYCLCASCVRLGAWFERGKK